MKRLLNSITAATDFVRQHELPRLIYFAFVLLCLLLVYLNTEAGEVSFIYNEF